MNVKNKNVAKQRQETAWEKDVKIFLEEVETEGNEPEGETENKSKPESTRQKPKLKDIIKQKQCKQETTETAITKTKTEITTCNGETETSETDLETSKLNQETLITNRRSYRKIGSSYRKVDPSLDRVKGSESEKGLKLILKCNVDNLAPINSKQGQFIPKKRARNRTSTDISDSSQLKRRRRPSSQSVYTISGGGGDTE